MEVDTLCRGVARWDMGWHQVNSQLTLRLGPHLALGESFLTSVFACICILYFKGGKKSVGSETAGEQVAHFAGGYQCYR